MKKTVYFLWFAVVVLAISVAFEFYNFSNITVFSIILPISLLVTIVAAIRLTKFTRNSNSTQAEVKFSFKNTALLSMCLSGTIFLITAAYLLTDIGYFILVSLGVLFIAVPLFIVIGKQ